MVISNLIFILNQCRNLIIYLKDFSKEDTVNSDRRIKIDSIRNLFHFKFDLLKPITFKLKIKIILNLKNLYKLKINSILYKNYSSSSFVFLIIILGIDIPGCKFIEIPL